MDGKLFDMRPRSETLVTEGITKTKTRIKTQNGTYLIVCVACDKPVMSKFGLSQFP